MSLSLRVGPRMTALSTRAVRLHYGIRAVLLAMLLLAANAAFATVTFQINGSGSYLSEDAACTAWCSSNNGSQCMAADTIQAGYKNLCSYSLQVCSGGVGQCAQYSYLVSPTEDQWYPDGMSAYYAWDALHPSSSRVNIKYNSGTYSWGGSHVGDLTHVWFDYLNQWGTGYEQTDANLGLSTRTVSSPRNESVAITRLYDGCPNPGQKIGPGTACTTVNERNHTEVEQPRCTSPEVYDPVRPLTGARVERVSTGIALASVGLMITYDSTPNVGGSVASALLDPDSFGLLWKSNFHHKLAVAGSNQGALVSRGDGRVLSFDGDGTNFTALNNIPYRLATISGGYVLSDLNTGTLEQYDAAGTLQSISLGSGAQLSFTYSGNGRLASVQASDGRTVRFEYGSNGLISRIVAPDTTAVLAGYDANKNLTSLTWQDGKVFGLVYENTALPWALTGKVDENGQRFATFTYDDAGRATSSELAGGADAATFSYGQPPAKVVTETYDSARGMWLRTKEWQAPSGVAITEPGGQTTSMEAQSINGAAYLTTNSQPAGSGCSASTSSLAYDASGNIVSHDDFTGSRVCYAYDSSSREIARVEGLSASDSCSVVLSGVVPAYARKITTTWHPDWRMPATVTQPLKKTTIVYQGQPDPFNSNTAANCTSAPNRVDGKPLPLVCKRVEQALLADGSVDSTVAASSASFTYDSTGHVTSSVDPRGNTTTAAYYADENFPTIDTDHDSVVLLLHGAGAAGSRTIVDSSASSKAVTAMGDAQISTAQSKFGGSSIALDGAGDYLRIPNSSDFNFGGGNFTIEGFFYKTANNANTSRIWNPDGDYYDGVNMNVDGAGVLAVYVSTTGTNWSYSAPAIATLANGRWYHLAVVRSGGNVYVFVDGVRTVVTTALGTTPLYSNPSYPKVIGGQSGTNRALSGFVDEFRITKGVARYTANFIPASRAFGDSASVSPVAVGHDPGDLQSVTNAAGQVMQYTQYDAAARVRQMTDAKGVVTDITYTPRGKVATITITPPGGAARVTSYTYDFVGQVTAVHLADGTHVSFSYDAAHRLTGYADARGNTVSFTLDAVGNRIGEEVRDPSSTLQRAVSRSFDALNRLQQVIGATQ